MLWILTDLVENLSFCAIPNNHLTRLFLLNLRVSDPFCCLKKITKIILFWKKINSSLIKTVSKFLIMTNKFINLKKQYWKNTTLYHICIYAFIRKNLLYNFFWKSKLMHKIVLLKWPDLDFLFFHFYFMIILNFYIQFINLLQLLLLV